MRLPRSGNMLVISKVASVQFNSAFRFRVIKVHDWPTYEGWLWIDGYEIGPTGDAVARRSIFVMVHGLRWVESAPIPQPKAVGAAGANSARNRSSRPSVANAATKTTRTNSAVGGHPGRPSRRPVTTKQRAS
jgi:hypothetical protein